MDLSKSSEFDFICTRIDALKDIIKEESEIKVTDTSHNAISIGEVGQELFLLTKSLYFPPNYLRIFWNNPPIFLRKVNFFSLRILENRWIRTLIYTSHWSKENDNIMVLLVYTFFNIWFEPNKISEHYKVIPPENILYCHIYICLGE